MEAGGREWGTLWDRSACGASMGGRVALVEDRLPGVAWTSPIAGERGVSVLREMTVGLSEPLGVGVTVSTERMRVVAAGRRLLGRVEISSDRRVLTWFPLEPVPGGAEAVAEFNTLGLKTGEGRALDGDGDGKPGGIMRVPFVTAPNTAVPGTAVIGRVYASELVEGARTNEFVNRPLEGVTVTVDGAEQTLRAVTDAQGNFVLTNSPAGRFFVHVDGRTAVGSEWPWGAYYPFVGKAWEARAGVVTNLAGGTGEIFLPRIPANALVEVEATRETVVGFTPEILKANPGLEGVTVTIPANALFSEFGARGGRVGIAPVAPDRLPEPLPQGLNFPLVITIQTDGPQNLDRPAPVRFPNLPDPTTGKVLGPGSKTALWSFDHDTGHWAIQGPMTVTPDGKYVESDPGYGVRQPGWHGVTPGSGGGGGGPPKPPAPDKKECPSDLVLRIKEDFLLDVSVGMNVFPGSGNYAGAALQNFLLGDGTPQHYGPGSGPSADLESSPAMQNNLNDIAQQVSREVRAAAGRNPEFPTAPGFDAETMGMSFYGEGDQLRYTFGSTSRSDNTANVTDILITPRPDGGYDYAATLKFTLKERYEFNRNDDSTIDGMAQQLQECGEATPFDVSITFERQLTGSVPPPRPLGGRPEPHDVRPHESEPVNGGSPGIGLTMKETRILDAGDREIRVHPDGTIVTTMKEGSLEGTFRWIVEDLEASQILMRGDSEGGPEMFQNWILPPNRRLRVRVLHLETRAIGQIVFLSESAGFETRIPPVGFRAVRVGEDQDADGLEDEAEEILGTRKDVADSDGDGMKDGAELVAGKDPLDGRGGLTGAVAAVGTAGFPTVVAAENGWVLTGGFQRVQLFNAFGGMAPRLVGQWEYKEAGSVTSLAIENAIAAGAYGQNGVFILALGGDSGLRHVGTIPMVGATCVAIGGGYVYVVGGTNGLTVIDAALGQIVGRAAIENSEAVTLLRDRVIVGTSEGIVVFDRWEDGLVRRGQVAVRGDVSPLEYFREIIAADDLVYRAAFQGYSVIGVDAPDAPRELGGAGNALNAAVHALALASRTRLCAITSFAGPLSMALSFYDASDPAVVNRLGATLEFGRIPRDVAISEGIAYVISGEMEGSLRAIRFAAEGVAGRAPSVRLDLAVNETVPGATMILAADAEDDGLVTRVEFWNGDRLLAVDTTYPFEARVRLGGVKRGEVISLRARAQDNEGLATWSERIAMVVGEDRTPPRLIARQPAPGSVDSGRALKTVRVQFNEPVTRGADSQVLFSLIEAGPDGLIGTGDDRPVLGEVELAGDGLEARLHLGEVRYAGNYQVNIEGFRDAVGIAMTPVRWNFRVQVPVPELLYRDPSGDGELKEGVGVVRMGFDRALSPESVVPGKMRVRSAGVDGVLETADDGFTAVAAVQMRPTDREIEFRLAVPLGNGVHRVEVAAGIAGLEEGAPADGTRWEFRIQDSTPPRFLQPEPPNFARLEEPVTQLLLGVNEPLDVRTIEPRHLKLTGTGPDGMTGTADDLTVESSGVDVLLDLNSMGVRFRFPAPLSPGRWQWEVLGGVRDAAGNAPETLPRGGFTVLGISTLQGQLLLPEGVPATHALITEIRSGRTARVGDDGRFVLKDVSYELPQGVLLRVAVERGAARSIGEWSTSELRHLGSVDLGSLRMQSSLGERVSSVSLADVDRDGLPDVLVGGRVGTSNQGAIWVHLNRAGVFTPERRVMLGEGIASPGQVRAFPVAGKTTLGVFALVQNFRVFTSEEEVFALMDPLDQEPAVVKTSLAGYSETLGMGDITGDGVVDVFGMAQGRGSILVSSGNGVGTFSGEPSRISGVLPGTMRVAWADVTGDGAGDWVIIAGTERSGTVRVLPGMGSGRYGDPIDTVGLKVGETITLADVNGDGRVDLTTGSYGGAMQVAEGLGDGRFRDGVVLTPPVFAHGVFPTPLVVDLDGDGVVDLVSQGANGGLLVWKGKARPGIEFGLDLGSAPHVPFPIQSMHSADMDGDGKMDILVVGLDGEYRVLRGGIDVGK